MLEDCRALEDNNGERPEQRFPSKSLDQTVRTYYVPETWPNWDLLGQNVRRCSRAAEPTRSSPIYLLLPLSSPSTPTAIATSHVSGSQCSRRHINAIYRNSAGHLARLIHLNILNARTKSAHTLKLDRNYRSICRTTLNTIPSQWTDVCEATRGGGDSCGEAVRQPRGRR